MYKQGACAVTGSTNTSIPTTVKGVGAGSNAVMEVLHAARFSSMSKVVLNSSLFFSLHTQHVFLIMKAAIMYFIPDTPAWIEMKIAKAERRQHEAMQVRASSCE